MSGWLDELRRGKNGRAISLTIELRQGEQFEEIRQRLGSKLPENDVIKSKIRHYALMRTRRLT